MWQFVGIAVLTIAALFLPRLLPASTTPEDGTTGTPNDSLLSRGNIEFAGTVFGLVASVAGIYLIMQGKKGD